MSRYPLYIFDLDGTLYRGDDPVPKAVETVRQLKEDGSGIRYLTNNSTKTRAFFLAKLQKMGFPVELSEIESSGHGAVTYLASQGIRSIFVVGETGLVEELRGDGVDAANANDSGLISAEGGDSEAVLVGLCRQFTYDLMNAAMQRIRSGQTFVATNADTTFPLEGGRLVPGAGSIVAAIRTCSEREPFVVGKPNPYLISLVLSQAKCSPTDALVVGDRMDTDIASGIAAGCPTHLVLTGVSHEAPAGQSFSEDLTGLL